MTEQACQFLAISIATTRLGLLSTGSYVAPSPQHRIPCKRYETELTYCPIYGFKPRVIFAKGLTLAIFYAQGVKTNVLFFTKGEKDKGNTKEVWVYDMRANMPQFGKRTPFTRDYFRTPADAPASQPRDKFEDVFGDDPKGSPAALARRVDTGETGRWRKFTREQIAARGDNLDIAWLKDDSAESAEAQRDDPALVARLLQRELGGAMAELRALLEELGEDPDAALDDLLIDETGQEAQA